MIVQIEDAIQVAQARRRATQLAESLHFDDTATGKVALVATELATNVLKHGGGRLDSLHRPTTGSPGTGLGAIARVADAFDVYSLAGHGTAVLCKVEGRRSRLPGQAGLPVLHTGGVCVPKRGEEIAGDAWTFPARRSPSSTASATD